MPCFADIASVTNTVSIQGRARTKHVEFGVGGIADLTANDITFEMEDSGPVSCSAATSYPVTEPQHQPLVTVPALLNLPVTLATTVAIPTFLFADFNGLRLQWSVLKPSTFTGSWTFNNVTLELTATPSVADLTMGGTHYTTIVADNGVLSANYTYAATVLPLTCNLANYVCPRMYRRDATRGDIRCTTVCLTGECCWMVSASASSSASTSLSTSPSTSLSWSVSASASASPSASMQPSTSPSASNWQTCDVFWGASGCPPPTLNKPGVDRLYCPRTTGMCVWDDCCVNPKCNGTLSYCAVGEKRRANIGSIQCADRACVGAECCTAYDPIADFLNPGVDKIVTLRVLYNTTDDAFFSSTSSLGTAQRTAFQSQFSPLLAEVMGVSPSRILIGSITAAATNVRSTIHVVVTVKSVSGEPTPTSLVAALEQMMNAPVSNVSHGGGLV